MIQRLFLDPFTPLGKWLSRPFYVHFIVFILLLSAVIFRPILNLWENHSRLQAIQQDLEQKQTALTQQKKILLSLQKQTEGQQLSPELGAKIMPLNKQIQRQAARFGVQQNLHWEMGAQPILHLQLSGHFNKTKAFLTALLANAPLSVNRLQFSKTEDSPLQTEIIFQLHKETP